MVVRTVLAMLVTLGCWVASAGSEAPLLHMSFDGDFAVDGAGAAVVEPVPKGQFVPGISGQGFIPAEDVTIAGNNVWPAPEGTVALWIKPVEYEADWVGGPALSTGRIGAFLRVPPPELRGDGAQGYGTLCVRRSRHDCCSGLHWAECWSGKCRDYSYDGPIVPFLVWQQDAWRLLTVVWLRGERRIYYNGVRAQHGLNAEYTAVEPGRRLIIPAGSKAVDELTVWDVPLTDARVAALFYAHIPQADLAPAIQAVTATGVTLTGWVDSFSGLAVPATDTLELRRQGTDLMVRYREPMPRDYLRIKTLLGGTMLRRSTTGRDTDVRQDDCVEVQVSPDAGKTTYVFAVSASGATYDARNDDAGYDDPHWRVQQSAEEDFWTVEMRINLASLTEGEVPSELTFNCVRTVRQQGFSRRQWSFRPGLLRIVDDAAPTAALSWDAQRGKLVATAAGAPGATATCTLAPLSHPSVLPNEEQINDLVTRLGRDAVGEPTEVSEATTPEWRTELAYAGSAVARASLVLTAADGGILARRSCLVAGSEPFTPRLHSLPSRHELVVQVLLASESMAAPDLVARIALTPAGADQPVKEARIAGFTQILGETAVDYAALPAGPYTVAIVLERDGKPLGNATASWFRSGDPEWLNNDIGVLTEVPAPWSPVRVAGDTVSVWGRDHGFTKSLLPASLRVLDEELLAGPMRLVVTTAAGTLDSAASPTPTLTANATGLSATIAGKVSNDTLALSATGTLAFDGFADLTFTLTPHGPVQIESIVFEVPFRPEYATLYDDCSYNMFRTNAGSIPAAGMTVTSPGTVRVGDTRRGVQFYPFFDELRHRKTELTFVPRDGAMVLRLELAGKQTLDQPVTTRVGLIGTPVKPVDAERVRMTGHAGVPIPADLQPKGYAAATYWFSTWTNFNGGEGRESGYYNYTPEWCRGFAESMKKDWEQNRRYGLLKVQPALLTVKSPEYALFWKEWGGQYYDYLDEYVVDLAGYPGAAVRPPGIWTGVDWRNESWQDFFFYGMDKVLAAFAAADVRVGIYVDCTNHDNNLRPYRSWMQRLYSLVRKYSPDGLIVIHMSGDRRMAVWGLADMLAEGEQYTANWQAHIADKPDLRLADCHPTVLPPDRMRAGYAGSLWGPREAFLSQFWTDKREGEDVYRKEHGEPAPSYYRRMRYSTGLMLVHDACYWGEFYACGAREEPWVARARWGYDKNVRFLPYWENGGPFAVTGAGSDKILASAWQRTDGALMAILLNTDPEPATVQLRVTAAGVPPLAGATDITTPVAAFTPDATVPDTFVVHDRTVTVTMPGRGFRLLAFEVAK